MKTSKSIFAPALAGLLIGAGILLVAVEAAFYFLLPAAPPSWLAGILPAAGFRPAVMGLAGGLFVLVALLQWLSLRRSRARLLAAEKAEKTDDQASTAGASEKEKRRHRDTRLYLHLLSVLQTEGRLLDFFNEDLQNYEDAQIGAAARGVHDNCRQALARYLTLRPAVAQPEGQPITVDPRTDPDQYQLSGNVTGEPPFQGVLTHPGWQAEGVNIPDFSFTGDPHLIAPAGVKIS